MRSVRVEESCATACVVVVLMNADTDAQSHRLRAPSIAFTLKLYKTNGVRPAFCCRLRAHF